MPLFIDNIFRYLVAINVGHGVARNTGIESCCNEIVVLCDADDYNLPNRFNILVGAMSADTSLSVVGSTVVEVAKIW